MSKNGTKPTPSTLFALALLFSVMITGIGAVLYFLWGRFALGVYVGSLFTLSVFYIAMKLVRDIHVNAVNATTDAHIAARRAEMAFYSATSRQMVAQAQLNQRPLQLAQDALNAATVIAPAPDTELFDAPVGVMDTETVNDPDITIF